MLSLDDFQRVCLEDKPIFDTYYRRHPPTHSDNLFTTMVSWSQYLEYSYVLMQDALVIMTKRDNETMFRLPSGKQNAEFFSDVLRLAKREGSHKSLSLLDVSTKSMLLSRYPSMKMTADRDTFDYVYLSSDLASLTGSRYAKIRNRLNKFKKNVAYKVEDISQENMSEVHEFLKRWCLWKDCDSDELLDNERKAILFSMDHYFELGLFGLLLRIDGSIEAISIYEPMTPDTVVIHYEKGSPEYDGIYKAINFETARRVQKKFLYINRETDMGQPGLRKAKLSYQPHHMVEVFFVYNEDIPISL